MGRLLTQASECAVVRRVVHEEWDGRAPDVLAPGEEVSGCEVAGMVLDWVGRDELADRVADADVALGLRMLEWRGSLAGELARALDATYGW